ncbi:programmed cell death protein 10-like [Heterodontus francisci]|uniref:programmed cell death protein 10-like n=1 Tax=Heterodontus francisci TaxID=7792 RepID=UPI00355C9B7F
MDQMDTTSVAKPTVSMALYTVMYPVFSELEQEVSSAAAQTLKAVFTKAEMKNPGLCQDLLLKILEQETVDVDVSYTEALLRMSQLDAAGPLDENSKQEDLSELREKGRALRNVLSEIADSINNRKQFIKTVRESAVAIKNMLNTCSEVIKRVPPPTRQELDERKKEFVIASRTFSDTLKKYFRDHRNSDVIVGALSLIHQINLLVQTFARAL